MRGVSSFCTAGVILTRTLPLLACIMLVACATEQGGWERDYLENGRGQLSQNEVVGKFGLPHSTFDRRQGTWWVYRYEQYSGMQRFGLALQGFGAGVQGQTPLYMRNPPRGICHEYLLFFDDREVLQSWVQRNC